ncbi:hypothetical protein PFLmoz3_00700 [Pseudomonas fluorescens]|uniref:Uncharacterized protein n=1 Tax=Pseudomonas fluorescens TaxID=294 RepID=A0A109LKI1_PSEFL|nr:hypothetical protein PFLmoz3_00700 [Pseudomonas fluorescens]
MPSAGNNSPDRQPAKASSNLVVRSVPLVNPAASPSPQVPELTRFAVPYTPPRLPRRCSTLRPYLMKPSRQVEPPLRPS